MEGSVLGVLVGLGLYLVLTDLDTQRVKQDVKKLNTHTHDADGSINGIRGWY